MMSSPLHSSSLPILLSSVPPPFNDIMHDVANGSSITAALRARNILPEQFYRAINRSLKLRESYARARQIRSEQRFESITDIANAATRYDAHLARVKIDAIKWQLSKEDPKRYGDHPAEVNVNTKVNVAIVSEAQRQELIARHKALLSDQP
jgi:hypothetical protein